MDRSVRARISLVLVLAVLVAVTPVVAVGRVLPTTVKSEGVVEPIVPTTVWQADEYEPDDTTATAPVLPAASYHTWHVPTEEPDQDWFKITIETSGTPLYVETMNDLALGQNHDPEIYLYDAEGSVIAYNDDKDFWCNDAGIQTVVDAGTYYVQVRPDDWNSTGSYWLYWGTGIARRIGGADRYETAVEVSRLLFSSADNANLDGSGPPNPAYAVIASGQSFADGLVGGTTASFCDAPLLLTAPNALPIDTYDELTRLFRGYFYRGMRVTDIAPTAAPSSGGGTVFVIGGSNVVSDDVVRQIEANPYVGRVIRVGGPNRYATAAMAMAHSDLCYGLNETAFVVNGLSWADTLAAGPVAAWNESALLLTAKSSVPASTTAAITDLGITNVVVVGSETVVDAAAYAELEALVGAGNVERVSGDNRYQTAYALAEWGVMNAGMSPTGMTLVSGQNFPDGMSAGPISWWTGYPLLLTRSDSLALEVEDYMDEYGPFSEISYLIGGSSAVSDAAFEDWNAFGAPWTMDR